MEYVTGKPVYRRLPRDRFAGLPLAPPIRVKDSAALREARDRGYCEWCGLELHLQASHSISRGSGGGDTRENLTGLCVYCHTDHHQGKEPTTEQLLMVAAVRETRAERVVGKWLGLERNGKKIEGRGLKVEDRGEAALNPPPSTLHPQLTNTSPDAGGPSAPSGPAKDCTAAPSTAESGTTPEPATIQDAALLHAMRYGPLQKAQSNDWLLLLRPSPDDPHAGRRLAKVLKWLLRQANVRCVDMRQV